jgi:hypothetical protein
MAISAVKIDARVAMVAFPEGRLEVTLRDGRVISAPLDWFPRLANASEDERRTWEPSAAGLGIHWPLADEDLSVEGLLHGGGGVE